MNDKITLTGIEAIGYHGVYLEERRDGQRFIADVTLFADLSIPGKSDALADATDYSLVAQRIYEHLIGNPVDLIERLADRIALDILNEFSKVTSVEVTIHKPDAPVGLAIQDIALTILRGR